jgi:DNA sulfur modification protein DndD
MAVVYLDSLTIENFGPFYGEHEFKFSNLDGRCGILIGGKNGAGKTHLLRALYLAVVGETGRVDLAKLDRESDATKFNLEKSLNRFAQSKGHDTIKLGVNLTQRDENGSGSRKLKLVREIRFRPNSSAVWRSYAKKSGSSSLIDDEGQIEKLRDNFLPRHLARFFFFDAEKSQNVNLRQGDIVDGITRILGLWSYSELENDLRNLIQQKIPRAFDSAAGREANARLAALNGQIAETDSLLKYNRQRLGPLEVELREAESELEEIENELKSLGAVNPEDLSQAQERRVEIARTKAELEEQLKTAWEQALPVALLGEFRQTLSNDLVREEKRREWESSKSAVEPKIPQVKKSVFEDAPPEFSLPDDTRTYYLRRLEEALHGLFNPPPEGMAESVFLTDRNDTSAQVRQLLHGGSSAIADLAERSREVERLGSELRELDSRLKQLSQNQAWIDRGRELSQKRGELLNLRAQLQKQLDDAQADIAQHEARLAELRREESNLEKTVKQAEQGQNLAAIAARYRESVSHIRLKGADQLREQIAETVGILWTDIVQREREFAGMEFDPYWSCRLLRRDGNKVDWDDANTSAGQRQVRMLAFYEALRRLAQLVPPLVVDTPLARLDKEVRANVLDRLYLSGHQSLILSTDSEIDPDDVLFRSIKHRLARVYTLHPHGEPDSFDYRVRVTSDYFGREL